MLTHNIDCGNLEAIIHGYKNGFLKPEEYNTLCQCDSLGDVKSQLQGTEYGNFLQNDGALTSRIIADRATDKFASEFGEIREWATGSLAKFLDFVQYEYMISNVLKLIAAKRSGRGEAAASLELLQKCHPLGAFQGMASILAATSIDEMFELVLIDSPIGRFFINSQQKDFDELSLEYIRGLLHKSYLETFFDFCEELGGETAVVMCRLLEFEADRLTVTITANTCGMRDLTAADRKKLYPSIGTLVDASDDLADTENEEQLKDKLKRFPEFFDIFDDSRSMEASGKKSLEKKFTEKAVEMYRDAMTRQMQFGVYYAWAKLKELEVSNLLWISDCVVQGMKSRVHEFVQIVA
jgi:V-type H+-transporting ATPase subunit d